MDISQNGGTTTIKMDGRVFKITNGNSRRFIKSFTIKESGKVVYEAYSFQNALDVVFNAVEFGESLCMS